MGCAGYFRPFIEQVSQDGRRFVRTTAVNKNASIEKLGFRADVLAAKNGFYRFKGSVAICFGILLSSLEQNTPMLGVFRLCEQTPSFIPLGKNNSDDSDHNGNYEECNGRNSISAEELL